MPFISVHTNNPVIDHRQSDAAMKIRSGVIRGMKRHQIAFLPELTLSNNRRADLIGLDEKGSIIIVEIKSSLEDFKVDNKWHEYKDFCDQFYFATSPQVPAEIFPEDEGFILADEHGCEIIRDAETKKLSPATRKSIMLKFSRNAAQRLEKFSLHEGSEPD